MRTTEEAATPNLIASCHTAFFSVESKIEMSSASARNEALENVVNGVCS